MSLAKRPPRIGDDELGAGVRYGGPTQECGKPRKCEAFPRAAEGIRTLNLLHGKQNVWSAFAWRVPCKRRCSQVRGLSCDSTAFTATSRGFGHRTGTRAGHRYLGIPEGCGGPRAQPLDLPALRRSRSRVAPCSPHSNTPTTSAQSWRQQVLPPQGHRPTRLERRLREQRRLLLAKLTAAVAALIALEGELVEPIHERA